MTTNTPKVILLQPGFPPVTDANVAKFATKLEKVLVDGEFTWDLMDRAGLTYKFNIGDKAKRAIFAFEADGSEASIRAKNAIEAISQKVRSGELTMHFKPGSAAERDIAPVLMKEINPPQVEAVVEVVEDFDPSVVEI